ncbi:MAG: bifunctional nuclease family protein [Candidatus Nanopelagicales bacterium]|nr:bifunctional nuclease family protein [Candidatus Nanopelagicales bacterium]
MDGYQVVEVVGVRVEMPSNAPIVLVRPISGGAILPIWIGPNEAAAIAMAQQGVAAPRPLTHDLFVATLLQLGTPLLSVRITRLEEGVFFAELVLESQTVDARPSDAIALALRAGVPILLADEVLAEAGVAPDPEEDADEVEQFREFLDTVTPQDFQ